MLKMNKDSGMLKTSSGFLSIVMILLSMTTFAQNKQKTDEVWNLLLSNDREQSREIFEKNLRKDIDKSIEILLLDAYLDNEEGALIHNTDFVRQFITFDEAKNYLYSRSEEHTSELQSRPHLVCRLLLE